MIHPLADQGPHAPIEAAALNAASAVLAAQMDFGKVPPLDISTEIFPEKLQTIAKHIDNALEAGCKGFLDVIGHLVAAVPPGHVQDLLRAELVEVHETPYMSPPLMAGQVEKVREYHVIRSRWLAGLEVAKKLQAGEDPSEAIAELSRLETITVGRRIAFSFVSVDDMEGVTEAADFVESVMTEGGASVVYGPSNCGKSFWVVDLGVCVATGAPFRDELEVEQGAVIYVALEGAHGARNRIAALKQSGKLPPGSPFFCVFDKVSLLEAGHDKRLSETVAQVAEIAGLPVKLVIIDTMARAMAGGDENSGQDMTAAVGAIDAVRAATGAHVCVVHHCGKDEAKGARGHSSLRAAVDTEIEVFRPEGESVSTVRVTKQRDLAIGSPMPFSLEVVELGRDRRGNPITSCVVRHEDEIMASEGAKPGRPPAATDKELLSLLPQPSTAKWQKAADNEFGVSKSSFHRALKRLQGHGALKGTEGQWIAA